jgi:antitoxin MazE
VIGTAPRARTGARAGIGVDKLAGVSPVACSIDIVNTSGAAMRVTVKKWGNSASVRIPASVMAAARLSLDSLVDIREEDGRIIIEPERIVEFELDALVEGITKKNQHGEVDFGGAVGKEWR